MADPNNRVPENVPGSWYIDDACIICGLCGEMAPAVFKANADYSTNYVHHQPSTPEELEAAEEARSACPMDAIGNNGE
jgi:ferredoxin